MPRQLSPAAVAVLDAIASGCNYGFDIMEQTELPSGTVYPLLSRFLDRDWVQARWEEQTVAAQHKRPPRKYYRITAQGQAQLRDAAAYYQKLMGGAVGPGRLRPSEA